MFKMSSKAQTIKVYNFLADTKEFIGASDCYIPEGTGLPLYCTDIEPPVATEGCVVCFDKNKWQQIEDHRGFFVWEKSTRKEVFIEKLGPISDDFTAIKPSSDYDSWDGNKWVKDKQAEKNAQIADAENKKTSLLRQANDFILPLQDAVEIDIATDEEKKNLMDWKKYRVLLNRVDCVKPVWPDQPSI
jgi:hypothetical protein